MGVFSYMAATLTSLLERVCPSRERVYTANGTIGRVMLRAQRLQATIDQLNRELNKDRAYLLQHMQKNNLDKIFCQDFSCQLKERHNWRYSPETERNMLQVKQQQRRDIADGTAVDYPKQFVYLATVPSL